MHTPGPWTYDPDDKLNPDRAFGIVRPLGARYDAEAGTDGATEVIAEVCVADGGTAESDARLIAAAPELLAALEQVAKASEDCGDMNDIDWSGLRAAIAKARNA